MRRALYVVACVLVSFVLLAAQDSISGIQMDFHETRTRGGAVLREMTGSFFLASDGSWRLDRELRGERLTVIFQGGEQIEVNHDLGVAVRGPAGMRLTVPTIQGYGSTIISQSFRTLPPPLQPERMEGGTALANLGSLAVGPLLLDGEGWAMDGHEIERWSYRLADNTTVILEYSATHTADNGMQTIDERRVTNWERVTASRDTFELPDGMQVYTRWSGEAQR